MDGERRRRGGLSTALACLVAMVVVPSGSGDLPQPLPLDFASVGNIDSRQDIELSANLHIPDGSELTLPLNVPLQRLQLEGSAPPKVVSVTSPQRDGVFGVGEVIDLDVKFSSKVAVFAGPPGSPHDGLPTITLRTGCTDELCHVKEVQKAHCQADGGVFSLGFDDEKTWVSEFDQTTHNIPWDADPEVIKYHLESLTNINEVSVRYSSGRSACSTTGITIFVTFDSVNIDGDDGDLPELRVTRSNEGGSTDAPAPGQPASPERPIFHATSSTIVLPTRFTEVVKGRKYSHRIAKYVSGSGTDTLRFQYVVQNGDSAEQLDSRDAHALELNGGTIVLDGTCTPTLKHTIDTDAYTMLVGGVPDGSGSGEICNGVGSCYIHYNETITSNYSVCEGGNVASIVLPVPGSEGSFATTAPSALSFNNDIAIDVSPPTVVEVTSSKADGTYGVGEVIDVDVVFSAPVATGGLPELQLETGDIDRYAGLVAQPQPHILQFRYTVGLGDTANDLNYMSPQALTAGRTAGGFIKRNSTNATTDAVLTLVDAGGLGSLSFSKALVIITSPPVINEVTSDKADGTYGAGEEINITTTFSAPVVVTGTPRLPMSCGAADLYPGHYLVRAPVGGNANQLEFPNIAHGLSTAVDKGSQFTVNAQTFTIVSVSGNIVTVKEAWTGPQVAPTAFNAEGTPQYKILAPKRREAVYVAGGGTNILTFTYTVGRGDTHADLDLLPRSELVATAPVIESFPINLGQELFGASTTGTQTASINRLSTSSSFPAALQVVEDASPLCGNIFPGQTSTGAPCKNLATRKAIVIHDAVPQVLSISSSKPDGHYGVGQVIDIQVTFDRSVSVEKLPAIQLAIINGASNSVWAVYSSGSGTPVLVFTYTIKAGDSSADLDYTATDALTVAYQDNSYIRLASTNPTTNAKLSPLPAPGAANSLGANKAIIIDTTVPYVTRVVADLVGGTYGAGEEIDFTVHWSAAVDVAAPSAAPYITMESGSIDQRASYISGTGTTALKFRYVVQPGDASTLLDYKLGTADYTQTTLIVLNGAAITASAGGGAVSLALPKPLASEKTTWARNLTRTDNTIQPRLFSTGAINSIAGTKNIVIDTSPPQVLDVFSSKADGVYGVGERIIVSVKFSSPVTASSTTKLMLETGDTDTSAPLFGGSGTDTLAFRYDVTAGHGTSRLEVTSEAAIVCTDIAGISTSSASNAQLTSVDRIVDISTGQKVASLFAVWVEFNGLIRRIKVSVLGSSALPQLRGTEDFSPHWSSVVGATDLNKDTTQDSVSPRPIAFNSKLYVIWVEAMSSAVTQIRAAVYSGDDSAPTWAFVDGNLAQGLNLDAAQNAAEPCVTSHGGSLYVAWHERSTTGNADRVRIKEYNGNDAAPAWNRAEGAVEGLNVNFARHARSPHLASFAGKLYAAWVEEDSAGVAQVRVSAYSGTAWSLADGGGAAGLNVDPTKAAAAPRLADLGGTLFCAWHETNNLGITQIRAMAYDGSTWARIDAGGASGLNADTTRPAQDVQLNAFIGAAAGGRHAADARMYLNWRELSSAGVYQQIFKSFEPTNATGASHGTGTMRYENLSPELSATSAGVDSASVHVLQQPAFGAAIQSYRMYSVWTEADISGAAPVLRAAIYSGNDDQPRWYSVTDSCLRRTSTTPTTPIMRVLPSPGALHSLSAKSNIVIDTLAPEVLSVTAHTRHKNGTYTVASLVQTVDVVTQSVGGGDYAKFRLVYGVAPVGKLYSVKSPPLWTDCLAHDASAADVKTEVLAKMPGLSSLLQTVEKKDPPHSASPHFSGHRYVFTFAAGAVGIKAFGKDFTDCSISTNKFVTDDTNNFVRVNRDTTTPLQPGILELFVQFSQPVVVDTTSGTPTLELETGTTNRQAVYTAAGTVQAIDVGVTAPGQITAGEFKLKYCPDPSTCGAAQTTKCIAWHDGQSVSASSVASRLLELEDVRVLGIESVQSTPRGNGMRFTVNFGAGDPARLQIAPTADLTDCEKFSSSVQTIDVSASSAISAGGFKLKYGSLETTCIDWNAADEATDGTSVKEKVEAMGAGVLKVGVTKDLAYTTHGHRYVVTFSSPTTSILPLVPSVTGCTTFNPNTADVLANADIVAANVAADTLTFKYKITAGDEATKLDYTSTNALALNSGTIFRASSPSPSQAAVLTLPHVGAAQSRWLCSYCSLASSSSLAIDGRAVPTVTSVHAVLASCPGCDSVGTFGEGEIIDMLVTFTSPVVVVGKPVLRMDTGSTTKAYAARYASGSGTSVLYFTYIVQAEDFSSKLQYESLTALQLVDGAYIRRTPLSGAVTPVVDADLTLPSLNRDKLGRIIASGAPGEIIIEARASARPTITSIDSTTSDATYHVGEELDIEVTFSREVAIVGTPQLKLSANGAGATPVGSSAIERYAVYTAGGRTQIIDVGVRASAQVTGGQYKLQYGGGGLTMTTACIDWNAPATALIPATGSSLEEKLLEIAAIKTIGIQSVIRAKRGHGYRYTIMFKSGAGVQVGVAGETKHSAPLALTAVPLSSVNVCTQFVGGADAIIERPYTQNVLFRYTVQAGDTAADLDVSAVETPNGAAVRRASSRPTTDAKIDTWGSKLSDNKNIVIDTTVPTVLKVEAWTAEAAGTPSAKITTAVSYGVGLPFPGQINLHVTFSAPVTVIGSNIENKKWLPPLHPLSTGPTPPWGSVDKAPTLEVATGGHITSEGVVIPNRKAVYSTGSGTDTLIFVYTVQELDQASDLTYSSPTALQLSSSGGAIKATSTNPTIDAVLTLPAPGTANALGTGQDVTINDNSVPTIARITSQKPDGTYGAGEQIDIEVIFSKRVRISTGLNKDKTKDARAPVSVEMNGKLYTLWSEKGNGNMYEVRAVVGNAVNFLGQSATGTPTPAWKFVDAAALQDPSRDALFPSVAVKDAASAADSKLYAAWTESNSAGHRVRIAVYGGNDNAPAWTYVDTGINAVAARNPRNPHIVGWGSRIVVAWEELGDNGFSQIRVALYNGDDSNPAWSFMDSGSLNRNTERNAHRPHLAVFNRGVANVARIYCTWTESDGLNNQVRVRELNYSPGRAIWTFFDGGTATGLNVDRNMSASDPSLFVSQWGTDQAQLWLAWNEGNASCIGPNMPWTGSEDCTITAGVNRVQVSLFNNDLINPAWRNIDSNQTTGFFATRPSRNAHYVSMAYFNKRVFLLWSERTGAYDHVRVARYAPGYTDYNSRRVYPETWEIVDDGAGLNLDQMRHGRRGSLTVYPKDQTNARLYAFWNEQDGRAAMIRVKAYDGSVGGTGKLWTEVAWGTPQLKLRSRMVATQPQYLCPYVGGSGTTTLVFRYLVQSGDASADLDVFDANSLIMYDGSIEYVGSASSVADLSFARCPTLAVSKNIVIDTAAPTVTKVTSALPDGNYGAGQDVPIDVEFSAPVSVSGVPRMRMMVTTTDRLEDDCGWQSGHNSEYCRERFAYYSSGTGTNVLTFVYQVQLGQTGLSYAGINHANMIGHAPGSDRTWDLTYDGPGAVTHYLNGTTVKRLATTPVTDAILTLPQAYAASGLKMQKNIVVDTKQTRVLSVDTAVAAGTYGVGEEIDIVVTFTHNVSVHFTRSRRTGSHFIPPANVSDPTDLVPPQDTPPAMQFVPYLVMETGAIDRRAPYVSGNGTNSLTFRYIVEEGDTSAKLDVLDTRHKLVQQQVSTALRLPDGCGIRRWSTNPVHDVDLTLAAPGDAGSMSHTKTIIIDSMPPVITKVTSLKADGTYGVGEIIDIDVFFSRRVKVTGVPVLQLDTGGKHRLPLGDDEYLNNLQTGKIHWNSATSSYTDADSYYIGGSGTNKLTFRYVVRFADVTPMLDYASRHAMRLNTRWDEVGEGNMGTINSYATHATQPADLTLPVRGTRPATIIGPFSIASSGNRIAIRTDGAGPTSVTADVADGVYGVGQEIFIVVHFREPVRVTGTPHLVMAIKPNMEHDPSVTLQYPAVGTNGEGIPRPVYGAVAGVEYAAPYVSGSGTKELRFKYVVGAGHKSAALEYTLPTIMRESQIILTGGATITDDLGSVPLGLPPPGGVSLRGASLSKSKNIVVDSSAPYVKSVTTVAPDAVYGVGEAIDVNVHFDRKVVVVTPPSLLMETGGTDRAAAYVSGSGGYSLLFRYVVQDNDKSLDLNYQSEAALTCTATTTSLNKVAAQAAQKPVLAVVGSSLYAVWIETSITAPGNTQVRAAVYSGNDALPSWGAVHSSLDPPLNKVATQAATQTHAAALGSKLFVAWTEASAAAGVPQVRVAEFAGTTATAPWTFVDGNGATGLNVDTSKAASDPHLVACNAKLYVLWGEEDKIRLSVYGGGSTWTLINGQSPVPAGPQLNRATAEKASSPRAVCRNNMLYMTWVEEHLTVGQVRVLRYNANEAAKQFKWVDGRGRHCVCDTLLSLDCCLPATAPENSPTGLNWDTTKTARAPDLIEYGGTLYAAWSETDGTVDHARLTKFNADDAGGASRPRWPFVDGNTVAGMNVDATHDARRPKMAVHTDAENTKRLVVAWEEANDVPATQTKTRLRAMAYNGTVFVSQHLPEPPDGGAAYLSLQPVGTRLYGAWQIAHGPTTPYNTHVYAGAYVNGGGWRHASDTCIKLQASTPTVPAHLTLPPAAGASLSSAHAIVVDSDPPTVTRVVSVTRNGTYSLGDEVSIDVTFSDPVVVQSGVPTLHLDTSGGVDRRATYSSGSGTKNLRFRYTVGPGDAAGDLSYATTTSLVGQIMRYSSTPVKLADLTLPRRGSQLSLGRAADVVVGMVPPIVLTVNASVADGTYGTGAAIPITVTFDRNVFVKGMPSLKLALSEKVPTPAPTPALSCASLHLAVRGAPTVYDWAVQPHRVPSMDGTAYNWTDNNVSWHAVFGVDNHPFVSCHTEQRPEAVNGVLHSLPSNTLTIRSNSIPDHNVGRFPMDHPGGTVGRASLDNPHRIRPQQLQVEIPANPVARADAATAKSLREDPKALPEGAIGVAVNGVPIFRATDALGQDVVSSSSAGYQVTDLCGGRTQSDGAYHYTHRLDCVREDVPGQHSPLLGWALDGYPIYGMHSDGGLPPTDLDQCNGRLHPSKGYIYHVTKTFPYTLGCFKGQICDRLRPGLCPGAPPPAVQQYAAKHVPARYTGGSGTTVLTFSYVVSAGESAAHLDYMDQFALELGPGGAINDDKGLGAALTLLPPGTQVVPPAFTPPVGPGGLDHMASLHKTAALATPTRTSLGWNKKIVIDTEPPRVLRVFSVPPVDTYETSVTYGAGQLVYISVLFDMPVAVTGTPRLWLETGAVDREALYLHGTGTANLTFAYVVQEGDVSAGLDYKRTCKEHEYNPVAWDCIEYGKSALYAPAGTSIRRLSDSPTTDAILNLPHPGMNDGATPRGCTDVDRDVLNPTCTPTGSGSPWSAQRGSLAFHSSIVIDTTPPFVRAVRSSKMPGVLVPGDILDVQVVFNHPVNVTGTPRLRMQTGHGAFASPLQTVDVSAISAISAGGFKLKYGSLETACIDWNAAGEATDGTSVKEKVEAMGAGTLKVGVRKDVAYATHGHRYIVTFSSPKTSILPLIASVAGCTAFNPSTADVSANGYQYAYYNADWSEGAVVTFLYTVTEQDKVDDVSHHSINALDLVGGTASIKRSSTTPTTDVLTTLPEPHQEIDHHSGTAWKMAPSTRLGEHSQTIESVELVMRKLHHEHASDLRVELQHGGKKVLVFDQVGGAKTFGRPREHPHPDDPSPVGYDFPPENPVVGDGFDYVFRDIEGTNLALAGHATQSSTGYDGVARRAIDGSTNGQYSALSTTHTGGHGDGDAEPWWQVRLGIDDTTPLGTVKLWGREQEDNVNEVQIVQTTTLKVVSDSLASYGPAHGLSIRTCASLAGGRSFAGAGALHERLTDEGTTKCGDDTFRLTVPFGGLGSTPCDTELIHYSAVAEIADEDAPSDPLGLAGARPGESVQAKLQACPNVGQVRVRRSPPDTSGGYQWVITFVGAPGNLDLVTVKENNLKVPGATVRTMTVQDGNDNKFYNYEGKLAELEGRIAPAGCDAMGTKCEAAWLMVLPSSFADIANSGSLEVAKRHALWKKRVTSNKREQSFSLPLSGVWGARFVRVQLEGKGYLSIAEVQVFEALNRPLKEYSGGSPISATSFPGGLPYAPEESFNEAFRGMSAEGDWQLVVNDLKPRQVANLDNSKARRKPHGMGGLSDWILRVTDTSGDVLEYYMDIDAQVQTLPKYGNLYVGLSEAEAQYLDRDANGHLDREEARQYCLHYVREFHRMDVPSQKLILDRFMADYELQDAVRIQEEEGLQRYLSQCYGPVTDTYNIFRMDGQNDNMLRSTCRDQFGVGNRLSTNVDGAVARKNHVVRRQRTVRYVPIEGYKGKDSFTFRVRVGQKMSEARGTVKLGVRVCRGYDECGEDDWAFHQHQRHSRNGPET